MKRQEDEEEWEKAEEEEAGSVSDLNAAAKERRGLV